MKKRIFSFLLALVMLLSLVPVTAQAVEPSFTVQPVGGPALEDAPITVNWKTNFTPVKLVLRRTIEHPVDGLVNTHTALDAGATSCQLNALASGYYTILAYYTDSIYVVSDRIDAPRHKRGTDVIFTADSEFKVGGTATMDIEAMAQQDEELMDAYFNGEFLCQWRRNGAIIPFEPGMSYTFTEEDAGAEIQAALVYADCLSLSDGDYIQQFAPIWVGGVMLEDGNYLATGTDWVTDTQPDGGYAHYEDGILVLENYGYEGPGHSFENGAGVTLAAAVYAEGDLDVIVLGENVLNQTVFNYSIYTLGDLYIAGNGSLHVTYDITSSLGDIWIDGATITVSDIDVHISADNRSVSVSKGVVNARIHACYDIEITGGRIDAVSNYAALDAGRNITIYSGSVSARTTHHWADENSHAIEYGTDFEGDFNVYNMAIRASEDPEGLLEPYVAENHDRYDLIVIEEPAFTRQPQSGVVAPGGMLTVRWETNFVPIRIEIYDYDGNSDYAFLTLPGTATSAELPASSEGYYMIAYYSDSIPVESEHFQITEGEFATVYFCFGETPIASQDVVLGQCAVEPEAPGREGMEFLGWYTADGEYYYFDQPITEDLYLYAKFGHYLVFCFGETPISAQGVEHGQCGVEPEAPGREGMEFLGWYTELTGGEKYDFSTPVTCEVYLYARFVEAGERNPFSDVPEGSFFYEPVLWAVENGITTGATPTTFNPNGTCLRAQVVTFLHRAAGSPEPNSRTSPFTDVKPGDFFFKPVLWAVDNGITNGTSATTFGSYDNCNRAAVVTFLWRNAGSPEPKSTTNPFVDVKTGDFFYKPVLWAVENGITNGVDATHFGPATACNRAQVVTFLYRAYN